MSAPTFDPVAVVDLTLRELVRYGVPVEVSFDRAAESAQLLLRHLGVAAVTTANAAYWMGVSDTCRDVAGTGSGGGAPVRSIDPTPRESDVLRGIAAGQTNAEIGQALGIAPDTVKSVVRRLMAKLDVADRAHAVARGFERGWLRTGPGPGGLKPSREASRGMPDDVSSGPPFPQATVAARSARAGQSQPVPDQPGAGSW